MTTDDMALAVEREFPQLNDSLISTVQLTRLMADDRSVSSVMIEEAARRAHQSASALDFSQVVKFDRIKPVLYGAGGALLFFMLLAAMPGTRAYMATGFHRLLNPLSDAKYPSRTQLVLEDTRREWMVPRGDSLSITAFASGVLPDRADIVFDHSRTGAADAEQRLPSGGTNRAPRRQTRSGRQPAARVRLHV